jgi:hypothetical protein
MWERLEELLTADELGYLRDHCHHSTNAKILMLQSWGCAKFASHIAAADSPVCGLVGHANTHRSWLLVAVHLGLRTKHWSVHDQVRCRATASPQVMNDQGFGGLTATARDMCAGMSAAMNSPFPPVYFHAMQVGDASASHPPYRTSPPA